MFRFFGSARPQTAWLSSVALSTVFGCAAGAVGTLLVVAFVAPSMMPEQYSAPVTSTIGSSNQGVSAPGVDTAVRSLAFFAPTRISAATIGSGYVPAEAVSLGMVLTSDGWIVAHDSSLMPKSGNTPNRAGKDLTVVVDGRAHVVKRVVRDPYTGTIFAKIDASDLPVAPFGEKVEGTAGDQVYAIDAAGGVVQLTIAAIDVRPTSALTATNRSSEEMQRLLRLVGPKVLPGSMILDRRGVVIAVSTSVDDLLGTFAVPISEVSAIVGSILRSGNSARPVLGLQYADLSRVASVNDVARRGAYVSSVSVGGPAAVAGVRAGDTIVSVNAEAVSSKKSLSEIVADYVPGDRLTLSIMRGSGAEMQIIATLGPALTAK